MGPDREIYCLKACPGSVCGALGWSGLGDVGEGLGGEGGACRGGGERTPPPWAVGCLAVGWAVELRPEAACRASNVIVIIFNLFFIFRNLLFAERN